MAAWPTGAFSHSEYDGTFPSTLSEIKDSKIQNASIFEIAPAGKLAEIKHLPLWLDAAVDKQQLFNGYLSKGMLKEAWFALNSKGWSLKDAANALAQIANQADNELFYLVAENWTQGWSRSGNPDGSY